MTFYVNYITYLLVTLMSSVVRYSGHYNLILRTIQYYIPKLLYSIGIQHLLRQVICFFLNFSCFPSKHFTYIRAACETFLQYQPGGIWFGGYMNFFVRKSNFFVLLGQIRVTNVDGGPGWNCLNFLHVFVGYQANFLKIYIFLQKTSMHQNFTDSI